MKVFSVFTRFGALEKTQRARTVLSAKIALVEASFEVNGRSLTC